MKKYNNITRWLVGIFSAALPMISLAATPPKDVLDSPEKVTALFCAILVWMFWGLIVFGIAMFLVGGYIYATSNGDPEKVGKATKTLTYAAIAIAVAIVAKGVPTLIGSLLGVTGGLNAC